ncbi:MAG TPA: phage tail protein [Pyrinomonadaceae bacterium]|nr:phage tail protein [Pyrinomonadaceae bacterium]
MTTGPRPFSQFSFLVDLGIPGGPHAGFQEYSHIKIGGLNKSTDVTMKRGVISAPALQDWLNQRKKAPPQAHRTVAVTLQDEQHQMVRTWALLGASIIKFVGPTLNGKSGDVAIEELVLGVERIELKKEGEQYDR